MSRARVVAIVALVVFVAVAALVVARSRLVRKASAQDIADVRLDVTSDEIVKALPMARAEDHAVQVAFGESVADFEEAELTFARRGAQHVTGIRLVLAQEKEEKARKSGHGDDLERRFASHLPNANQNELQRNNVRFWSSPKELAFDVKVVGNDVNPTHTDAQVDIARDVLVAIAFGFPLKHSDKEIADTLGTGYPVADVARARPLQAEALMTQFPGSTRKDQVVRIPLVHPLIEDVELRWKPALHVGFHMTNAFQQGEAALAACIAKQPASSLLEVRQIGLGTVDETTDPAAFASLLQAVDACR